MTKIDLWSDPPKELKMSMSPQETELLTKEKPFAVRSYGNLNQDTLEALIIGHMVADSKVDESLPEKRKLETIASYGIKESWFERADLGRLFLDLSAFYKQYSRVPYVDEMGEIWIKKGHTPTEANAYKHAIRGCRGALHSWRIGVDILLERFWAHHSQKLTEKMHQEYKRDCEDQKVGPITAGTRFAEKMRKNIRDPQGVDIKAFDFVQDFDSNMGYFSDMKDHPEKYKGYMCGIKAIDRKTHGFRKGHLTVIVGAHGGFKTTLMMNIAYGCYLQGHNILYISLEMEKDIVEGKLWCMATGMVSYSRLYQGHMTHPKDWDEIDRLEEELKDVSLSQESRLSKQTKMDLLKSALKGVNRGEGKEDYSIIKKAKEQFDAKENKFITINAGQSKKMKASQIEAWIQEQAATFKPDLIFLDYLALMDPETPNPDRPDIGFGEICQYLRQMGKNMDFSAVTAAQIKRSAIERVKKHGVDTPEKAELDTADIADSHRIGGDADNVFILWRETGGNSVRIFTAKARYGEKDTSKGETVQVDHETCTISDNVRDTSMKASDMTVADANKTVDKFAAGIPTYPKTDLSEAEDDIFSNPNIDQPLDGDGSGDDSGPTSNGDGLDI